VNARAVAVRVGAVGFGGVRDLRGSRLKGKEAQCRLSHLASLKGLSCWGRQIMETFRPKFCAK